MTLVLKQRSIQSFVRRQGRLTRGQKYALEHLSKQYVIPDTPKLIDFTQLFKNNAACKIEIGIGNGDSLLALASANPDCNFIGIDVHLPGIGRCLAHIDAQQLHNVRLLCGDAVEILQHRIASESVHSFYLFFPDPWHKKRHHKRRIVQTDFVQLIAQKLHSQGIFHIATDWENYAEHIFTVLQSNPSLKNTAVTGKYTPRPIERPLTKFEQRGLRLGHSIFDLVYQK